MRVNDLHSSVCLVSWIARDAFSICDICWHAIVVALALKLIGNWINGEQNGTFNSGWAWTYVNGLWHFNVNRMNKQYCVRKSSIFMKCLLYFCFKNDTIFVVRVQQSFKLSEWPLNWLILKNIYCLHPI